MHPIAGPSSLAMQPGGDPTAADAANDAEEQGPKRRRIWAACELCRTRKARCNGEHPCSACINKARSAMPRTPGRAAHSAAIEAHALNLCVFDWDRAPRGPKAKPQAATGANSSTSGVPASNAAQTKAKKAPLPARGAPRSDRSAGSAYMAARATGSGARRDSNSADGSSPSTVLGPSPSSSANGHFAAVPSAASSPGGTTSSAAFFHQNRSSAAFAAMHLGPGAHEPPQFPLQAPRANMAPYPYWQDQPNPNPNDIINRAAGTSHELVYSHHGPISVDLTHAPSTSSAQSGSSRLKSPISPLQTSAGLWAANSPYTQLYAPPPSTDPTSPPPSSWSGVDPASARSAGATSPQLNPQQPQPPPSMLDRRRSFISSLLNQLQQYYSRDDRLYIALAVAQFADLDASTKLFPARILWGVDPMTGEQPPPIPNHLQIALLSLLAHRALLLPGERSERDLEAVEAGVRDELLRCKLTNEQLREGLLGFARRSWNIAHDLLLQLIAEGAVDPLLLLTGYALDMSASEDGISSHSMLEMKAWLFYVLRAWRLDVLDLPAHISPEEDSTSLSEEQSEKELAQFTEGTPRPRKCDARFYVQYPPDRDALRRVTLIICSSYVWTRTSDDFEATPFSLSSLKISLVGSDNLIHRGAAWTPTRRDGAMTDTSVFAVQHVAFLLFGRIIRMLNTPLEVLLAENGPEPDLQKAVDEIEETLQWAKACLPMPKLDGSEMPLAVSGFLHLRVIDLLAYRLFAAIVLFQNFVADEPEVASSSLRLQIIMEPTPDLSSQYETLRTGHLKNNYSLEQAMDAPLSASVRPERPPPRPMLHISKDPSAAAMAPLFEVDKVVSKTLTMLENQAEPVAEEVEIDVSQEAWAKHFENHGPAPYWAEPVTHAKIPPKATQEVVDALWQIGDRIIRLLHLLGKSGSMHSRTTAEKAQRYRAERIAWVHAQKAAQLHG
ncbi:hypothetical protein IE81DRAFT_346555 [Ceraceosorus guamensis]|uniref:Zn(2)-C6 fungal-type domain-containing protein n=1 Tax=Ceraceosorus guamensis TaxID=1522189 RepID=A0A316W0H8_9BASI|nr:hypothetical protein IE81DRAFT_346555 [Ceraceosorus guamensis]PWN43346.1 hypothetical protein IE81DRAFT_346555 [Ceraceosorus guamensis]